MAEERGVNYTTLTADTLVCNEPCEFWGIIATGQHLGADVTVYDGRDAISGRRFHKFEIADDMTLPFLPARSIHFSGGLFVDVGDDVKLVTVLWERAEEKG